MERGELPNLSHLAKEGTYRRLATSMPALSPVAWSTFATGVDPSGHGIFDFIARDPRNYEPSLSSSEVYGRTRMVGIGPLRVPVSRGARPRRMYVLSVLVARCRSAAMRVPIRFVEKTTGHDRGDGARPARRGLLHIMSDGDAPDGGVVVNIEAMALTR
jgi:hypothetical protein